MLTQREFKAVTLLFGLNGKKCRSVEQTAKYLGVSAERVAVIKEKSLIKLKEYFMRMGTPLKDDVYA